MAEEQGDERTITMVNGELIGTTWREAGDVVVCDKVIADRWVKHGSARYGEIEQLASAFDFQPTDFPGADKFTAAGIVDVEGVKALIATHGDAWPKQVKGITKPIAAAVSAALEPQ